MMFLKKMNILMIFKAIFFIILQLKIYFNEIDKVDLLI